MPHPERLLLTGLMTDARWQAIVSSEIPVDHVAFIVPGHRYKTFLERQILKCSGRSGFIQPTILTIDQVWQQAVLQPAGLKLESSDQRRWVIRKALREAGQELTRGTPDFQWEESVSSTFRFLDAILDRSDFNLLADSSAHRLFGSDSGLIGRLAPVYARFLELQTQNNIISREQIRWKFAETFTFFNSYKSIYFCGLDEWIPAHWQWLRNQTRDVPTVYWIADSAETDVPWQSFAAPDAQVMHEKTESRLPQSIHSFQSAREEVQWIADQIKQSEALWHTHCIVTANAAVYHPWIRLIFEKEGIPFNISLGNKAASTSPGQLFSHLLSLLAADCSYRTLRNFLLHPLVNRPDQLAVLDSIREEFPDPSGCLNWIALLTNSGRTNDLHFWNGLTSTVRKLTGEQNWTSWIGGINTWFLSFITPDRISDREQVPFTGWEAINMITRELDTFATDPFWEKILEPSDFSRFLMQRLESMSIRLPVRSGVQVPGPMEMQGFRFQSVWFCGLDENCFPSKPNTGLLINVRILHSIDSWYVGRYLSRDQRAFQQILSNPLNQLNLSVSASGGTTDIHLSTYLTNLDLPVTFHLNSSGKEKTDPLPWFFKESLQSLLSAEQTGEWTEFDGIVKSGAARNVWINFLRQSEYKISPSFLDQFAHCGLITFFERVLKLQESQVFSPEQDPMKRGSFLHAILQHFLKERNGILDFSSESKTELFDHLKTIAANLSKDHYKETNWLHQSELAAFLSPERSPLMQWLESEESYRSAFATVQTSRMEEEHKVPYQPAGGGTTWLLHGRIDRIDTIEESGNSWLGIFDYKTGSVKSIAERMKENRSFQLLIYYLLTRESGQSLRFLSLYTISSKPSELKDRFRPWIGFIDDLKRVGQSTRLRGTHGEFKEQGDFVTFLDGWQEAMDRELAHLEEGRFHMNPTAHANNGLGCPSHCSFQTICRRNPLRTQIHSSSENPEEIS